MKYHELQIKCSKFYFFFNFRNPKKIAEIVRQNDSTVIFGQFFLSSILKNYFVSPKGPFGNVSTSCIVCWRDKQTVQQCTCTRHTWPQHYVTDWTCLSLQPTNSLCSVTLRYVLLCYAMLAYLCYFYIFPPQR